MHMPLDWPRINQFPEWYTVSPGKKYEVSMGTPGSREKRGIYSGEKLARGLSVKLTPGEQLRIKVLEL